MKKGFVMITVLLILVTVFCTTGTVMGMEKGKADVDEKYYRQAEKEYVKEVRSFLKEAGYENSGVTLTKLIYADGTREYTLSVHHKRIGKLSLSEQDALRQTIAYLADFGEITGVGVEDLQVVFL